jgi:hypothetical protein
MKTITINIDDTLHDRFVASVGSDDPLAAITSIVSDAVESNVRSAAVRDAVQSANAEVDLLPFDSIKVSVK